jgi:hypothetical protein
MFKVQRAVLTTKLFFPQRFDGSVMKTFLPPKHEFVILVGLCDLQASLYEYYIENVSQIAQNTADGDDKKNIKLLRDYQVMRRIWTHPLALKLREEQDARVCGNILLLASISESSLINRGILLSGNVRQRSYD